jgi:hypothetical protein
MVAYVVHPLFCISSKLRELITLLFRRHFASGFLVISLFLMK